MTLRAVDQRPHPQKKKHPAPSPQTRKATAYVVDGLHGKVEGHELADGLEAAHGRAARDASKTHLGDGSVNHALAAKLLQQTAADLQAVRSPPPNAR